MATKNKVEHGFLATTIGVANTNDTMTKASFFEELEKRYPSSDWEVWHVESTPRPIMVDGSTVFFPYVAYFVRKVN